MGLFSWFESRLGIGEMTRKLATEKRPPKSTGWWQTLGFAALVLFGLQAITGIALGFFYVPAADHAYDSIRVLEAEVPMGKLLRALHHWGASAMVVLVFLHLLRVFFMGAYKRPREFTWLFGLGLFGAVIGLGFTGYLLPWDQKAYAATKVGVEIAAQTPVVGPELKTMLYGGPDINATTLNRFFALHVLVLPALLVLLLVAHMQQIQRHGITPARVRVGEEGEPGLPYHPYHTFREAIVAIVAVAVVFYIAIKYGAPLEAEADPADAAYQPRPDWYFAGVFELLKYFKGDQKVIATFWLPAGFSALLVLLPFIDLSKHRKITKRPICLLVGGAVTIAIIGLTVKGLLDKPTHYATPPHPLHADADLRRGYDLTRREGCFGCHTYTPKGSSIVYGRKDVEGDAPGLIDNPYEAEDLAEYLLEPDGTMPPYPHLSEKDRILIGRYLNKLSAGK